MIRLSSFTLNLFGKCVPFKSKNLKYTAIHVQRILTKLPEELGHTAAADRKWVIDRGLDHLPIPGAQRYRSLIEKREALVILRKSSSDNGVLISSACPDSSVSRWDSHMKSPGSLAGTWQINTSHSRPSGRDRSRPRPHANDRKAKPTPSCHVLSQINPQQQVIMHNLFSSVVNFKAWWG